MQTITREQRHKIAADLAVKNRSSMRWIGFGFVAALAMAFMAYEQTTVPKDIDARHAFERLFNPEGENTVYDATGKPSQRRYFARQGDVQCRVHNDRTNDRAYDYDCVATVVNRYDCIQYVPFYVEPSSIGKISRPVDETTARQILADFKLLADTASC